ncbi:Eukaryotic translation initiation factor 3 subunit I [Ancistrocladus abbreviatus]
MQGSGALRESSESVLILNVPQGRINRAVWGPLSRTVISAGEVVLGGGQDASAVTTTHGRAGNFEATFFDKNTTDIFLTDAAGVHIFASSLSLRTLQMLEFFPLPVPYILDHPAVFRYL